MKVVLLDLTGLPTATKERAEVLADFDNHSQSLINTACNHSVCIDNITIVYYTFSLEVYLILKHVREQTTSIGTVTVGVYKLFQIYFITVV